MALTVILLLATVPSIHGETYSTQIAVSVNPDPAGIGQQIKINGTITPSPPEGYFYEGITIVLTRPDGTTETLGPFTSDSTGTVSTVCSPIMIGTYSLYFINNEQTINGNLYMQSGYSVTDFVVHDSDIIPENPNTDGVPPVASFSFEPSTPELGVSIIFNASETFDPDGTISEYYWDFGDGTTTREKVTSHAYSSNGTYTVVLSVVDDQRCMSNTTRTIEKLLPKWSLVPQPMAPEFSLSLEAYPYEVAPVYSLDPYTGENVTLSKGYTVKNNTIIITIQNQPAISAFNGNGYSFGYDVRVKGHYGENWKSIYSSAPRSAGNLPGVSDSLHTVLRVPTDEYPTGSELDFQVIVVVFHDSLVRIYDHMMDFLGHWEHFPGVYGTSEWSNTQTIILDIENPEQTPDEPTPTEEKSPQQESSPLNLGTIVLILLVAFAGTGLLLYLLMRRR